MRRGGGAAGLLGHYGYNDFWSYSSEPALTFALPGWRPDTSKPGGISVEFSIREHQVAAPSQMIVLGDANIGYINIQGPAAGLVPPWRTTKESTRPLSAWAVSIKSNATAPSGLPPMPVPKEQSPTGIAVPTIPLSPMATSN